MTQVCCARPRCELSWLHVCMCACACVHARPLSQRQKQIESTTVLVLSHLLRNKETVSSLTRVQSLHQAQTSSLLCSVSFFPLCALVLMQSNEFTDDRLWLRGAESSVGWHYRKRMHIDTKKETEREYYAALLWYKRLSAWITLMTPDKP